jgi:S-adenosylmethionine hydrolase
MQRRPRPVGKIPIFTLTTDFGLTDSYVAEIKAVLLTHQPAARIVDITHLIAPQDVLAASFTLERALRIFPAKTLHIAVVDPGVGTDRRLLLARIAGQSVLCPDNGLITWPWRRFPNPTACELTWRPTRLSHTFHGRDVMAPAAAILASSAAAARRLAGPSIEPVLLDVRATPPHPSQAVILRIDHFGNATTNAPAEHLIPSPKRIRLGRRSLGPVRRTYGDVPPGQPLALIGSSGLLEIAVRDGHAARALQLTIGQGIAIDY